MLLWVEKMSNIWFTKQTKKTKVQWVLLAVINGAATVEDSLTFPQKIKHRITSI